MISGKLSLEGVGPALLQIGVRARGVHGVSAALKE
jgi:hypothetical protein